MQINKPFNGQIFIVVSFARRSDLISDSSGKNEQSFAFFSQEWASLLKFVAHPNKNNEQLMP